MKFFNFFKPSRLLKRLGNKVLEKLAGTFYEGPKPPKRLEERVQLFRLHYPDATPKQWAEFALTFGTNCYREGFARGYEWLERDWKPTDEPTQEQIAEYQAHDWSLAEQNTDWSKMLTTGYDPRSPLANCSPEQRRAIVEMMQGATNYPLSIDLSAYEGVEAPLDYGNPGFHGRQRLR